MQPLELQRARASAHPYRPLYALYSVYHSKSLCGGRGPGLPACKLIFAQAHFEAVLSRIGRGRAFREAAELEVLHAIDAPGARTWPYAET